MVEQLENPKIEEIFLEDIKIQSNEIGEFMISYHEVYWLIIYKYKSDLQTKEFYLKFSLKCILSRRFWRFIRQFVSLTRGSVWILRPHGKSFSILWATKDTETLYYFSRSGQRDEMWSDELFMNFETKTIYLKVEKWWIFSCSWSGLHYTRMALRNRSPETRKDWVQKNKI